MVKTFNRDTVNGVEKSLAPFGKPVLFNALPGNVVTRLGSVSRVGVLSSSKMGVFVSQLHELGLLALIRLCSLRTMVGRARQVHAALALPKNSEISDTPIVKFIEKLEN